MKNKLNSMSDVIDALYRDNILEIRLWYKRKNKYYSGIKYKTIKDFKMDSCLFGDYSSLSEFKLKDIAKIEYYGCDCVYWHSFYDYYTRKHKFKSGIINWNKSLKSILTKKKLLHMLENEYFNERIFQIFHYLEETDNTQMSIEFDKDEHLLLFCKNHAGFDLEIKFLYGDDVRYNIYNENDNVKSSLISIKDKISKQKTISDMIEDIKKWGF